MNEVFANSDALGFGALMTLKLLAVGGAGAFLLGTLIAIMRIAPVFPLRMFATGYTELVRNIPLLLVFMFCSLILPNLGTQLEYEPLAMVALAVYTSPFIAEVLRSGMNGVPVGQAEAARSLGLSFLDTVTLIVLPQALRTMVPPLINVCIALTKNTSVAGGFFVVELFATARALTNQHGSAVLPILGGAAVCYLMITVPLGLIAARVESSVRVPR